MFYLLILERGSTKDMVKSFIREESFKIDSMIKENFTAKKKSLKDNFIEKNTFDSEINSMKGDFKLV